jgi:hypothetical protein
MEPVIYQQGDAASMGPSYDKRWPLTVTKLSILAFKIAIIVILILAVVTPLTGGVQIKVPDLKDSSWSYDNGTLSLGTKVGVHNGGIFDINDFHMDFGLSDNQTAKLASGTTDHVTIRSGQTNNLDLNMAMDLNKMNGTALRSLVFNVTSIKMAVDVGAVYPLGWMSLNIGGNSTTDWQPLVQSYSVDVNNMSLSQGSGQYSLSVPYAVSVSDMISGASMDLKVTMRNSTGPMATTGQRIVLQPQTSGDLVLNLSIPAGQYLATHEEQLHFDVQAGFFNASVSKTYDRLWEPAISGLGIGRPTLSQFPQALTVPLHFNTSAPVTGRPMTVSTAMSVNSVVSGSSSTSLTAASSNNLNVQIPISATVLAGLQSAPASLALNVTLSSGGLTETQTVQYQWSP